MATNRADTLDPALLRPGRLDRKIEFPLPDRRQKRLIFSTITSKMNLSEEVDLEDCILFGHERHVKVVFVGVCVCMAERQINFTPVLPRHFLSHLYKFVLFFLGLWFPLCVCLYVAYAVSYWTCFDVKLVLALCCCPSTVNGLWCLVCSHVLVCIGITLTQRSVTFFSWRAVSSSVLMPMDLPYSCCPQSDKLSTTWVFKETKTKPPESFW